MSYQKFVTIIFPRRSGFSKGDELHAEAWKDERKQQEEIVRDHHAWCDTAKSGSNEMPTRLSILES